jgi:perosamine synthetase
MNKMLLEMPTTITECLKQISANGEGLIFITENSKLLGSLSDGDIRRALLKGADLNDSVELILNKKVHFLTEMSSPIEIHRAFSPGIRFVPIVDNEGFVKKVVKIGDSSFIPLSEPNLSLRESEYLNDAIKSGWISSAGNYVEMFENSFANYVESKYAITVSNGTLGLVLALKILDIGIGDEVIVPNVTFGATANAVCQVGATPVFVDINEESMCIDTKSFQSKITTKTRAVIPVHLYGNAADIVEIQKIAKMFNMYVIEDAAEAIGTRIAGKHVGTFGDIGVFSFYANKTITTGEGGMLVMNDGELHSKGKMMRSHGFSPNNRYWHEIWGTNMRMTNLQAAIGCAQMERVEEFVEIKQKNAEIYKEFLSPMYPDQLSYIEEISASENSHWLFVIKLKNKDLVQSLESYLTSNQIETRRVFYPLNIQPAFEKFSTSEIVFEGSVNAYDTGLCLPSSTKLSIEQIRKITFVISNFFETIAK